jgi:hypothetical protein
VLALTEGVTVKFEELDRRAQSGYNADMTQKYGASHSELLGSPLPGAISLPYWRALIELRGRSEVLVWWVVGSPATPTDVSRDFLSLPRPVPGAVIKRGRERLRQRQKTRGAETLLDPEELLAVVHDMGGGVNMRRYITAGEPPLFGGAGVLDDFITLFDRPTNAIRAFAAHWGPLGICKHGRPWTHSLTYRSAIAKGPVCSPRGVVKGGRTGWEKIEHWRDYSRQARDISLEAIALRNSRTREKRKLEHLFARLSTWLGWAAVAFVAYEETDKEKPWPCGFGTTFAVTGVFQIVVLQLLGVMMGGRELTTCFHCGMPFALSGHREGSRRFCPACVNRKIAARYAVRDYRVRLSKHE